MVDVLVSGTGTVDGDRNTAGFLFPVAICYNTSILFITYYSLINNYFDF